METKRVCKECEKQIDLKSDKHVLLGTYSGEKIDDESYFHFNCFVKWYNQKVSEKAKNSVSKMQSKVQGLISDPKIAGLLGGIGGIDKLKGMLNLDLGSQQGDGLNGLNKMVADFIGDDPLKMTEGTITPLPKKKTQNGKPKRKQKTSKN